MDEWKYAESAPEQRLSRIQTFSVNKIESDREIQFTITVHEYATPPAGGMRFFAETDKQTNQSIAPYTPTGWGNDLLSALSDCIRAIERFPYQGE
jgi:hypothetical protein